MLIGIADVIADAADADDAAHRFWHWEHPDEVRPCSQCRETRDADDERVHRALTAFIENWAETLKTSPGVIEELLAEYLRLPKKAPR